MNNETKALTVEQIEIIIHNKSYKRIGPQPANQDCGINAIAKAIHAALSTDSNTRIKEFEDKIGCLEYQISIDQDDIANLKMQNKDLLQALGNIIHGHPLISYSAFQGARELLTKYSGVKE
jgi:hypothetical protein